jgi:hypothetical protein
MTETGSKGKYPASISIFFRSMLYYYLCRRVNKAQLFSFEKTYIQGLPLVDV